MKKIIIIGGGPAGLSTALGLLAKGHEVTLINNRDLKSEMDFIRPQRTTFHQETAKILNKYAENISSTKIKLYLEESTNDGVVQIKDVERVLFNEIQRYQDKFRILDHIESIQEIELTTQTLQVMKQNTPEILNYDYLVLSEGASRKVAEETWAKNHGSFELIEMDIQYRHAYHATVSLKQEDVFESHNPKGLRPIELTPHRIVDLHQFKKFGWEHDYPPLTYCMKSHNNKSLTVTGEIPQAIYEIEDIEERKQSLIAWSKIVAEMQMGICSEKLFVKDTTKCNPKKIQLRCAAFKTSGSLQKVEPGHLCKIDEDKNIIGGIFIVGDALFNSFYPKGYGLNYAIRLGDAFADCINEEYFDLIRYVESEDLLYKTAIDSSKSGIIDKQLARQAEYEKLLDECQKLSKNESQSIPNINAFFNKNAYQDERNLSQLRLTLPTESPLISKIDEFSKLRV